MFFGQKSSRHDFNLFTDYFQFYLQDEKAEGNLSNSWTEEATANLLAVAPGTIGIGTVRNTIVPVEIVVQNSPPDNCFDAWDHVVDCSIDVPSGKIVVAGCTDYFPSAARIKVKSGCYRARAYYGGLNTLSENGLDGQDRYQITLWPGKPAEVTVLKQR